ncbi:MAG: DUF3244 domain-containing protein [Dysgonamonadaceae bacterium]|jgi:hypothetical protein|nr:DUF3244 domain-containing protein [Dysgonamonadaceae bacterium]
MKKIFLFISLWGITSSGLFTCSIGCVSAMTINSAIFSQDEETIELHGYFAIGRMRSLVSPFEVTQSASFLTIHYLRSLADIRIEICDTSGQPVYSDTVDTVVNEQLLIDTGSWEDGNYTLVFTNSSGNCVYGSFEISN